MTSTDPPAEPPRSDQPVPPGAGAPWPPPPYQYPGPPQPQPQPPQQQPQWGPPQWGPPQWGPPPWVPPPVPPRRTAGWVVPVVVVAVLLMCGCLAAVGATVSRTSDRAARPTPARADGLGRSATTPADEEEPEAEPTGPRASSYPVRDDDDLNRVCDGYYYPQSPKFAGKAPHPIAVGVIDRKDLPTRTVRSFVDVPYSLDQKTFKAWRPTDGADTQLMVCADLAGSGKQVRKCAYDDPELKQVPLIRATYRVRLYEVATGRKLVDRRMPGNNDECPMFVLLGTDRRIYTDVADRDLYEAFRSYVTRK